MSDSTSSDQKLRTLADRLMADVVYAVGSGANSSSEERDMKEFVLALVECAEACKEWRDSPTDEGDMAAGQKIFAALRKLEDL